MEGLYPQAKEANRKLSKLFSLVKQLKKTWQMYKFCNSNMVCFLTNNNGTRILKCTFNQVYLDKGNTPHIHKNNLLMSSQNGIQLLFQSHM